MKPFYGRRKIRALSLSQQQLLEEQLPAKKIAHFEIGKTYHLEIGFGMGDFLDHISKQKPDVQFIGCEPFINGVISFLQKNTEPNVWLTTQSIHEVIDTFPDHSLEVVYILFPDPWPKKRHHKRRLIQKEFVEKLLKKAQTIYVATDHPDYAMQIKSLGFTAIKRPEFFIATKYEAKRKAGEPQYFIKSLLK